MTVRELIEQLNSLNPEADVLVYSKTEGYGFEIDNVEMGNFVGIKEPCAIIQLD